MKTEAARRDFYVYALLREDGVTPFYIGKGRGRRVATHFTPSALKRRSRKNAVIRKVHAALGRVPHEILHSGLTEFEAHEREREAIICLGRCADPRAPGPLTNMTDGGEGASRVWSLEARANARASALKPETRMAKSESLKLVYADRDRREVNNAAIAAAHAKPETKAKCAEGINRALSVPGWKEARTAKSVAAMSSPDFRAQQSARMKDFSATPEGRALRSAAANARWARVRAEKAAAT